MDWQPMQTAPKGRMRSIAGPKGDRRVYEPEYVIIALAENNFVMRSRWLPDEERWEGTSKEKNHPIGWLPWPAHPYSQKEAA